VTCVFCKSSPTTNEHIFPKWLRDVIPGEGRLLHEWRAPNEEDPSRAWSADGVEFKANAVCGTCNAGWMNDLEEAGRPYLTSMIQGRGRVLHEAEKETVTRWAFKTALMLDLGQEAKFRSIPVDDYVAFYEAEGLLPDTHVWLAGCDFGGGAGARTRTLDFNENGTTITGYGTTIQLGHLVIEIVRVGLGGRSFQIGGGLAPALVRVWPEPSPTQWPPPLVLDRQNAVWLPLLRGCPDRRGIAAAILAV